MADVKISGLPASTVPLAGTEVLPIVQSSTTKKVSIANVTAGRAVSALSFAPTGSALPVNGVFLPDTNAVGIATNSEERLRVSATGGLSIGSTADPGATNLSVAGIANIGAGTAYGTGLTVRPASNDYQLTLLQSNSATAGWGLFADTSGNLNITRYGAGYGTPAISSTLGALVSFSNAITVTNTGKFGTTIGVGAAAPAGSGAGITFPATQSPSSDANTLDDYEEGTFTLALLADSGTITLNASTMLYTKVGRLVTCTGYITVTSVSSPAGSLYFTGLPFTSNSASPTGITGFSVSGAGWGVNAATQISGYIDNNATTGAIFGSTVSTGANVPFAAYINSSTILRISMTYMTS